MVMRNPNDTSSPGWWDDLPPGVKKRLPRAELADAGDADDAPEAFRPAVLPDLARLAILLLMAAAANLLFLLIAVSFVSDRNPLNP